MVEHGGRCDDDGRDACPICRGEVSAEFVAMVERASAQPGLAMPKDEFLSWLDGQAASSR